MPMITLKDVSVAPETRRILGPVTISFSEQRVALIGANGAGKSTLARLINGLTEPTAGRVIVAGLDVARHARTVRRKVGFIFSDAENQIVMPTVREDVEFSLRRLRLPRAERDARVSAALENYQLTRFAHRSPHTLSSGQKQLLALAAVTVMKPQIIVADEPTTLLDLRNRLRIRREFSRLPQQLVVATHDLDLVEDFDRAVWLHDGRVVADGCPDEVLPRYRERMIALAHLDAAGAQPTTLSGTEGDHS